jgi:hypothetical protein
MILQLFRSRWFALLWIAGMAAFAVLVTAGGTMTEQTSSLTVRKSLPKQSETDSSETPEQGLETEHHSALSSNSNVDEQAAAPSEDDKPEE